MIIDIPHVTKFGESWSNLKIQWETVHLLTDPTSNKGRGIGFVFLDVHWLYYIKAMNTLPAFNWMIGQGGTIIWGITDKKHLDSKQNKARMPVIAIGGNQLMLNDAMPNNFYKVQGMSKIDYSVTPQNAPWYWHRIYCVTKLRKAVSAPHDTPRGPAYMPILDVSQFRRSKSLQNGFTYFRVP